MLGLSFEKGCTHISQRHNTLIPCLIKFTTDVARFLQGDNKNIKHKLTNVFPLPNKEPTVVTTNRNSIKS